MLLKLDPSRLRRRRAATVLEFALVSPLLFLLLIGLIIGGCGVFRYQQVAALAREAARHASVRGTEYATDTKKPAATQDSIYKDVVLAGAIGMKPADIKCSVTWDKYNSPQTVNEDKTVTGNIVTVTVTYYWVPEGLLGGMTLSSTSRLPMSH